MPGLKRSGQDYAWPMRCDTNSAGT